MRYVLCLIGGAALLAVAHGLSSEYLLTRPAHPTQDIAWLAEQSSFTSLEPENSPYFSRSTKLYGSGRKEIRRFRADHSVAVLQFDKQNKLTEVEFFRDGPSAVRVYSANYQQDGRHILQATAFDDSGRASVLSRSQSSAQQSQSIFWDKEQKQIRVRVKLLGDQPQSWEYFRKDGTLAHTGRRSADGSLEFCYFEGGKLRRRQIWQFTGEDWERSYYGLSYSELLNEKSGLVEHKVWLHSNGHLRRHERFNGDSGKLEMGRDFDLSGRTARVEEFDESGKSKSVSDFPVSENRSRGFVPDKMRDYPDEGDAPVSVYALEGEPFSRSFLQRQNWSFFRAQ